MKYIVETKKTLSQVEEDFIQSVSDHSFGVLHIQDLKETLNNKGVEFENECKVFEVCNPHKAKQIMSIDMNMNIVLPCRVSIYVHDNKTFVSMVRPKSLLSHLSDSKELIEIVTEVEDILIKIIQQAIKI